MSVIIVKKINFQEILLSVVGCLLFLLVGCVTLESYSHPQYGAPHGKVLAGLCFTVAATMGVNCLLAGCTIRG